VKRSSLVMLSPPFAAKDFYGRDVTTARLIGKGGLLRRLPRKSKEKGAKYAIV